MLSSTLASIPTPAPALVTELILAVVALLVGTLIGYLLAALRTRKEVASAEDELERAKAKASAIVSEAKATAKEELLKMRDDFETSTKETRREVQKLEDRLANRESNLDRKSDMLEERSRELEKREEALRASQEKLASRNAELDEMLGKQVAELERVAGLTREEARDQLLGCLEESLEADRAALIRRYQEESRQKVIEEGQEIMVTAMQRYAGDCTYERTTSTIPLPSDEMKGRIIGREGRNIRAIEAATGVSILIDDTPEGRGHQLLRSRPPRGRAAGHGEPHLRRAHPSEPDRGNGREDDQGGGQRDPEGRPGRHRQGGRHQAARQHHQAHRPPEVPATASPRTCSCTPWRSPA